MDRMGRKRNDRRARREGKFTWMNRMNRMGLEKPTSPTKAERELFAVGCGELPRALLANG
jgi:hypothetical protein